MDGSPTPGAGPADEIAALRRRLAFYESFDAVIQDNVRRSGDLLREAEERHAAALALAEEADRRLGADRARQRESLAGMSAALGEIGSAVAALARRVDAALAAAGEAAGRMQEPSIGPGPASLVVQGIADVGEAQAVREAVSGLPAVRSAAPREFAGGMLRIDLDAAGPIAASELRAAAAPLRLALVDGGGGVIVLRKDGAGE